MHPHTGPTGRLADIVRIIEAKSLTDAITCEIVGETLYITDRVAAEFTVIVDNPQDHGRDIFLSLPISPALLTSDKDFPQFDEFIRLLTEQAKVVLVRERRTGFCKYAIVVRFAWRSNLTPLCEDLAKSLDVVRGFYNDNVLLITNGIRRWELSTLSDEEFDKLPKDQDPLEWFLEYLPDTRR